MKKGLTLLLTLVLAAGLMGCGSTSGEDSRLTLARRALPDEPELTMAGIANLGDVCLVWVTAGGGEETLRRYPLEFQVTGENRYAFTAVLEAEMPIEDIYVCHREGLGDFVLVNNPDFAEVVVTMDDITIRLADTGPGIPDLDKAMSEGWTTAGDVARGLGFGAGMGLPNMKKNADTLEIDTVVGVGTTVTAVVRL